jgi:hypothetical protein
MQRLTFNMIGSRPPIDKQNESMVRIRLNDTGYFDASTIILPEDKTILIEKNKNIFKIKSNLRIQTDKTKVNDDSQIILTKLPYGIQEVLVDTDDVVSPGYVEIIDYKIEKNVITLNTDDYNGNSAIVKYLSYN